jgi:hypothetical protein
MKAYWDAEIKKLVIDFEKEMIDVGGEPPKGALNNSDNWLVKNAVFCFKLTPNEKPIDKISFNK